MTQTLLLHFLRLALRPKVDAETPKQDCPRCCLDGVAVCVLCWVCVATMEMDTLKGLQELLDWHIFEKLPPRAKFTTDIFPFSTFKTKIHPQTPSEKAMTRKPESHKPMTIETETCKNPWTSIPPLHRKKGGLPPTSEKPPGR